MGKNIFELEIHKDFKSKFELYDCVNSIGLEMTKNMKKGLYIDLIKTSSPREILETIESGLQVGFPTLRSVYLAYLPNFKNINAETIEGFMSRGFTCKGFETKDEAIVWLAERVN